MTNQNATTTRDYAAELAARDEADAERRRRYDGHLADALRRPTTPAEPPAKPVPVRITPDLVARVDAMLGPYGSRERLVRALLDSALTAAERLRAEEDR